ncbi:MAG: ferrous iron transporter B [Gammaproteobacteria bacterium]
MNSAFSVALVGCPNSGKTSLFNLLTGSFQRIANYAGVTVQVQQGTHRLRDQGRDIQVIDLPGIYGLSGSTEEQLLALSVLKGVEAGSNSRDAAPVVAVEKPNLMLCVIDASQLEDQLPLAIALRALNIPMVVVLNQMDIVRKQGVSVDIEQLSQLLGCACVGSVATRRKGIAQVLTTLADYEQRHQASQSLKLERIPANIDSGRIQTSVSDIMQQVWKRTGQSTHASNRLDQILLNPILGPAIMLGTLFLLFQAVFVWAAPPSEWIAAGLDNLGTALAHAWPQNLLTEVLLLAVLPGIGAVLEFLPPIILVSLFLLILEGTGYIARLAFFCDALLARIGLGGHAVFPMLSGFACAIPAIISVRSIPDSRIRLAVMMALPLVPCSARLPVYALVIAAVIPSVSVWGFGLQGLVLFGLYALGLIASLAVAAIISFYSSASPFTPLELPAYRWPTVRNILMGLWLRMRHFLTRAGQIILAVSVFLWVLSQIRVGSQEGIEGTLLGAIGNGIAPIFAPIGFSWEMSIALVPGFLAREVAVAALATVYAISAGSVDDLASALAADWSLASGLSFVVWYVFAPQCVATLGMIKSETGSWRIVGLTAGYLFVLAWLASFIVYQSFAGLDVTI